MILLTMVSGTKDSRDSFRCKFVAREVRLVYGGRMEQMSDVYRSSVVI